jgi:hypothetical protein
MAARRIESYNFDEYDHYFEKLISQNSLSSSSSNNLLDSASIEGSSNNKCKLKTASKT